MNAEPKVLIYGNRTCGYCTAARMLLKKKGVEFEDVLVDRDAGMLAEMRQRSGRRTVPQIFIGDTHVGGFDELYTLDSSGELDRLLADG